MASRLVFEKSEHSERSGRFLESLRESYRRFRVHALRGLPMSCRLPEENSKGALPASQKNNESCGKLCKRACESLKLFREAQVYIEPSQLRCHNSETMVFTIHPNYGTLN